MSRNLPLLARLLVVLLTAAAALALMGFGAGIPEASLVVVLALVGVALTVRRHHSAA